MNKYIYTICCNNIHYLQKKTNIYKDFTELMNIKYANVHPTDHYMLGTLLFLYIFILVHVKNNENLKDNKSKMNDHTRGGVRILH